MKAVLESGFVRSELCDGVMSLILDRPDKLNSLNQPMIADLAALLEDVRINPEVRCVLLRGEGRAFCSGDDIGRDISEELGPRDMETWLRKSYLRLVLDIFRLRKPVVAALQGYALGAALDLALAADFRIAATDLKVGLPPVKWAMGGAGTYLLRHFVGLGRATEMLLLGDIYPITDIADWGLVMKIVPPDQLDPEVGKLTARLAKAATGSIGFLKAARMRAIGSSLYEGLEIQAGITNEVLQMEDLVEGRKAWRERREPNFTGRMRKDLHPG